ncbi:MAG: tetratricopeptide repeat protein, partial [Verrucomicrobiota bacterium]
YLGALLAYLRWAQDVAGDQPSPRSGTAGKYQVTPTDSIRSRVTGRVPFFYGLAFILFLCALLSKTTTFSLPTALLLIAWWKRGQIRWRADVLPTLPFFILALGLCAVTAWLETHHVGAEGSDFALTFPQRCLIAGRAFWFYLGNLFWPANLCFIYPRWQPNPGSVWQWLYPAAAIGALFTLWLARGRIGREPVTALFFYVGTLFPVLGFMNAFGMRYSFVWDHWVYLSALGIIALLAALVVRGAEALRMPAVVYGFATIVLPTFALLTWRQAGMYTDMETLWRNTLAKNPDCWMAHSNLGSYMFNEGRVEEAMEHYLKAVRINPNNPEVLTDLGVALAAKGQFDEAIENYRKVIQINPDFDSALFNLGIALAAKGRFDEAIENYYKAIQISPNNSKALYNLGNTLAAMGRFDEAIENYRKANQISPNKPEVLNNLGAALAAKGRFDEAIDDYYKAIQIDPNYPKAQNNLGNALAAQGRFDEAIGNYRKAIQINPNYYEALDNLGLALATQEQFDEAIVNYHQAIQVNPNHPEAYFHLGMTLGQLGRSREAVAQYREALRLDPNLAGALNNLAWVLATCPDDALRNGAEAVHLAEHACELTHYGQPLFIGTLAAAYAESGRFPEAVTMAEKAEQLATDAGLAAVAAKNRKLLDLYRAGRPDHEPAPTAQ